MHNSCKTLISQHKPRSEAQGQGEGSNWHSEKVSRATELTHLEFAIEQLPEKPEEYIATKPLANTLTSLPEHSNDGGIPKRSCCQLEASRHLLSIRKRQTPTEPGKDIGPVTVLKSINRFVYPTRHIPCPVL